MLLYVILVNTLLIALESCRPPLCWLLHILLLLVLFLTFPLSTPTIYSFLVVEQFIIRINRSPPVVPDSFESHFSSLIKLY